MLVKSRAKFPQVFNLRHEVYCGMGKCSCSHPNLLRVVKNKQGTVGRAPVRTRICASFSLLPGETKEIGDNIARLPEFCAAVAARRIVVLREGPPPEEKVETLAAVEVTESTALPAPRARARTRKRG
jgi:hypothetical protein